MDYYVTSSGLLSADAVIMARGGFIHALTIIPAAADCSVAIYDNAASAAGTIRVKISALANGQSNHINFAWPIPMNIGAFADVSGTGANYIVFYSLG